MAASVELSDRMTRDAGERHREPSLLIDVAQFSAYWPTSDFQRHASPVINVSTGHSYCAALGRRSPRPRGLAKGGNFTESSFELWPIRRELQVRSTSELIKVGHA
jgi:hypothetical protein